MKHKRLIVAIAAVAVLAGGIGVVNTTHAEEAVVQPRLVCLNCTSPSGMDQICISDTRTYSGTREHSYGLFWSKTCTVTSYEAQGAYKCSWCGNEIPFEDAEQSDGLARHHCLEIHSDCGVGDDGYYLVCPFEQE